MVLRMATFLMLLPLSVDSAPYRIRETHEQNAHVDKLYSSKEERDEVPLERRGALQGVRSWLQPFLSTVFPGNDDPGPPGTPGNGPTGVRTQRTIDPSLYGLPPDLAPSLAISNWLGADANSESASIPEAFQQMMGGPPGIMMSVPPGEPRDGSANMPSQLIAKLAHPLQPPRLGVDFQTDGVSNLHAAQGGAD